MKTVDEVTGQKMREVRQAMKMPQHQFWPAVGVSQPSGARLETTYSDSIPEPVRILLFARYVAGLPVGSSDTSAKAMIQLGKLHRKEQKSKPQD